MQLDNCISGKIINREESLILFVFYLKKQRVIDRCELENIGCTVGKFDNSLNRKALMDFREAMLVSGVS